jgi:hypothetical protein
VLCPNYCCVWFKHVYLSGGLDSIVGCFKGTFFFSYFLTLSLCLWPLTFGGWPKDRSVSLKVYYHIGTAIPHTAPYVPTMLTDDGHTNMTRALHYTTLYISFSVALKLIRNTFKRIFNFHDMSYRNKCHMAPSLATTQLLPSSDDNIICLGRWKLLWATLNKMYSVAQSP